MFEAQVLYYLKLYLGRYVTGLDLQALRISVFQGDLELRNLRLKPEALNKLNLPITVKAGLLGSLKLKVRHPDSSCSSGTPTGQISIWSHTVCCGHWLCILY